ncbi:MotA/TolQ/ExbB proton channel family protein [Candidatus Dependentiae bacterium]|nr:MotA/TolQ/ExbB proton channel family protein [Candidatus Dependentiae bacterium]MBU4387558.1 MotA/TolQ/ExbB proton channel family protein [Candidatus Dependentiae bacterium]MCG2756633.1 MotA/TolQ/ExbB proton channel family protein [Candidatus Dependentiae bacterium]
MLNFIFKSPAWVLITQSDWMTKIILLGLFALSIVCVAIIVFKYKELKKQKLELIDLFKNIRNINNLDKLVEILQTNKHFIGNQFLINNLSDLKQLMSEKTDSTLTNQNFEQLEMLSNQHIDQILSNSEQYLPILGTSFAISPLIGLFGTVWGLIHAFVNISNEKSADLAIVAPGIAEALTTTLAGLIVAIPAMAAFNYFSNEIRRQEQILLNITDRYLNILKITYLK